MALRTKQVLRQSFMELLEGTSFDKITVRDITERSGVSRNTFYYYYQDIYALAEDIFNEEIEKVAKQVKHCESWQRAFLDATVFASTHKKAILHVYNSASRNLLEQYYHKTILAAMLAFVRQEAEGLDVSEQKICALARFYTAALTGLSADWLSSGMKGTMDTFLDDLGDLLDGNIRRSLMRVSGSGRE